MMLFIKKILTAQIIIISLLFSLSFSNIYGLIRLRMIDYSNFNNSL